MKKPLWVWWGRRLSLLFFVLAVLAFGHSGYVYVKAWVSQHLLSHAWQRSLAQGKAIKPWNWADTYPVGRLLVPRLNQDQILLQGTSGRVLAFGPGHQAGTPLPGESGNVVVAGHRDTHFAFLAQLKAGDLTYLQGADGVLVGYRIVSTQVISAREVKWLEDEPLDMLTLITCYPFEGASPQTDQRYLVRAVRVPDTLASI